MTFVLLGILSVLLWGSPAPALAATRLGLHTTSEELAIWQTRATSGPYRVQSDTGTLNSPGDWDRIGRYTADYLAIPTRDNWDGNDLTLNAQGCINGTSTNGAPATNTRMGMYVMAAAFRILVNPSQANASVIAGHIRTTLLTPTTGAKLDFSNRTIWCAALGHDPTFRIAQYWTRIIHTYDYLLMYDQVHGQNTLSAADKSTLNAWFLELGKYHRDNALKTEVLSFVNAPAGNFTLTANAHSQCQIVLAARAPIIYEEANGTDGPTASNFHGYRDNQWATLVVVAATTGALLNDASLQTDTARFVQEWITYNTTPDGTIYEFYRGDATIQGGQNVNEPDLGWKYSAQTLGMMVMTADVLARAGDTSVYDYSTTLSIARSTSSGCVASNTTTKTLQSVVTTHLNYADRTISRYQIGFAGQVNYQIDAFNALQPSQQWEVHFVNVIPGNLYWDSLYIQNMYLLNGSGPGGYSPLYFPGDATINGYSWWGGPTGSFPGIMFMFAENEGVVDPYATGLTPPTIAITAPTTFASWSTLTSPLTTLAGTASDDGTVVSVTWACTTCTPTSGTATGTTSWSVASIGLTLGENIITVTATDDDTEASVATLTVTYQSAPDITTGLELYFPFDEASGDALDASGHSHTGVISGGVSRVAGQVGSGAVLFNGSTGVITVSGLLGSPPALSLAAWIKLTAVPVSTGELLNIGNYVGYRVSSTALRGFHWDGSGFNGVDAVWTGDTAWHHIAYTVQANERIWYLDGVPIAQINTSPGITWTGQGSSTLIGKNPTQSWWFAGTLDELRVYTRPLTGVDIEALASASAPPTCIITTPATDPFSTGTSPLATFAGTASDDIDVDHVTWTNDRGGSGTATGAESWSVSTITLQPGDNILTATAHDDDGQVGTCETTVTYTAPPVSTLSAPARLTIGRPPR